MKKSLYIIVLLMLSWPLGASASSVRGDLDNSGKTDINDVTFLINRLLTGQTQWTCDINGDGRVNIGDVTSLINYLLSGEWPWPDIEGPAMPDNAVVYTVNGCRIVMVPVEGGTFMMGSERSGEYASPVHQVTLSDYCIGMTEVTFGLWKAVTGDYPSYYAAHVDNDDMPVWYCSWDQAKEFIAQLNELTGMCFRLPTEAQWEFAARGGNLSQGYLYAGSDDLNEVAWNHDNSDDTGRQHEVGLLKPNELGLYDMSGNVMEFCEDDYAGYSSEPQADPLGISGFPVPDQVVRGGYYISFEESCTVTMRQCWGGRPTTHGVEVWGGGFRLAL